VGRDEATPGSTELYKNDPIPTIVGSGGVKGGSSEKGKESFPSSENRSQVRRFQKKSNFQCVCL